MRWEIDLTEMCGMQETGCDLHAPYTQMGKLGLW